MATPAKQGCSTLSTEFPLEERIGSGESGSISILIVASIVTVTFSLVPGYNLRLILNDLSRMLRTFLLALGGHKAPSCPHRLVPVISASGGGVLCDPSGGARPQPVEWEAKRM
jgi:hypothetical protein